LVVATGDVGQPHVLEVHVPYSAQRLPHAPQLFTSLVVLTHLTPVVVVSQSVAGAAHMHAPAEHVPALPQEIPQPPQFVVSVAVLTQRPPHSTCPVGHAQTPLVHDCPVAHRRPHAPQLFTSLESVAQPVEPMQLTSPVGQLHAPAVQVPVPQLRPQTPQFFVSVVVLTQVPPQTFGVPVGHAHAPLVQLAPVAHLVPHEPQFVVSLDRSAHVVPQLTLPVGHTQSPAVQVAPVGQALPQLPQLLPSVCVFTQAPPHVFGLSVGHALQMPLTQVCPARHAFVHEPQNAGSLLRSAQLVPQETLPVGHAQTPAVQV
jgi:hypothetical protein